MEDDNEGHRDGRGRRQTGWRFRVTDGLEKDFGEHRVLDTRARRGWDRRYGSGSAALRGYRPVVEISSTGSFPRFNQIISRSRRVAYRSAGRLDDADGDPHPIRGRHRSVEHHSESPESFFCHIGGLRVVACSTPPTPTTCCAPPSPARHPVVFFEPKRRYWEKGTLDPESLTRRSSGEASRRAASQRARRPGTHASYGPSVRPSTHDRRCGRGGHRGRSLGESSICGTRRRSIWVRWWDPFRRTGRLASWRRSRGKSSITSNIAAESPRRRSTPWRHRSMRVAGFDTPYPPSRLEDSSCRRWTGCSTPSTG